MSPKMVMDQHTTLMDLAPGMVVLYCDFIQELRNWPSHFERDLRSNNNSGFLYSVCSVSFLTVHGYGKWEFYSLCSPKLSAFWIYVSRRIQSFKDKTYSGRPHLWILWEEFGVWQQNVLKEYLCIMYWTNIFARASVFLMIGAILARAEAPQSCTLAHLGEVKCPRQEKSWTRCHLWMKIISSFPRTEVIDLWCYSNRMTTIRATPRYHWRWAVLHAEISASL